MNELAEMDRIPQLVHVDAVTRKFPLDHNFVRAVDNVNLRVAPGEFLAIAGPSGSGKSTLLNLIGCIDKPTNGRILIDGVDTSTLNPARMTALRREKVGFVFQTFNLIPVFTAAENVEFPLLVQGFSSRVRRSEWRRRWKASASPPAPIIAPTCSPAVSVSAWLSPAPSCIARPWCWPTSLPQTSIPATPRN